MESTRIDRWLWAVRLYKTRSQATEACRGGHVKINGTRVKPSAPVRVGDTVRARTGNRDRVVEVAKVIDARVGAALAADCIVDHSPPPPPREVTGTAPVPIRGAGRPSKRDRRQLERLLGRYRG